MNAERILKRRGALLRSRCFWEECGYLTIALIIAAGAVFAAEICDLSGLQIAALGILVAAVLYLLVRSLVSLWHRKFVAFFLRFLAGILLLPAGAVGFAIIAMAGRFSAMMDVEKGTLPITESALTELQNEAGRLAEELSASAENKLTLEASSVSVEFGGRQREVEFSFRSPLQQGFDFWANLRFAQNAEGIWKIAGNHASGDTETFSDHHAAFQDAWKRLLPPKITWPVDSKTEEVFTQAANQLAADLTSRAILDLGKTPWRLKGVRFSHYFNERFGAGASDSVQVNLGAKQPDDKEGEMRGKGAYLFSYWTFDGKVARLREVSAGILQGDRSSSTREHGEAVRTEINEILSERSGGLLEPEKSSGNWETCTTRLPDGSTLTYSQQLAHPFLAEYNMRVTIERVDGKKREFSLPMNTGGRTAVFVHTGTTASGESAIRMSASRHFDVSFDLTKPAFIDVDKVLDPVLLGAFLQISTPLQWFSATDPDAQERLREGADYGLVPAPLTK